MEAINTVRNSVLKGPYEVQIVSDAGQPLPMMDIRGKPCVRSQCGMTYKIKVIIHRDSNGAFPASHLSIRAKVDGRFVGYANILPLNSARYQGKTHASTSFEGFRDINDNMCAFVFYPVEVVRCPNKNSVGQKEVGSISVTVYEAEPTTENIVHPPCPGFALQVGVDSRKKVRHTPSAVTVVGGKLRKFVHQPSLKFKRGDSRIARLRVYYHTAEMFDFYRDIQPPPVPLGITEHAAAVEEEDNATTVL